MIRERIPRANALDEAAAEQLPRVIGVKELSTVTGLSSQSIRLYMCQPKWRHLAPPGAFKRPGSKKWCWWLGDVLAWLASGKRAPAAEPPPRRPGRPLGATARAIQARRNAEHQVAEGRRRA